MGNNAGNRGVDATQKESSAAEACEPYPLFLFLHNPIEHIFYTTTDSPVIPAGFGTPKISSIVGAISASFPSLTPTA
ncbi:MAG: hypothetical protein C5S52_04895 [ANME-2 cluster archaeon]|nr:hypothetical protein [ANME-2 cluster archaeon]